jgi:hypothetical protein
MVSFAKNNHHLHVGEKVCHELTKIEGRKIIKYKIMTGCLVCWRQMLNQLVVLQGLPGLEADVRQLAVFQVVELTWS